MRRRFNGLMRLIRLQVDDNNAFAIMQGEFGFGKSERKVEAFMRWLQRNVDAEILSGVTGNWTDVYIRKAYRKGVIRANYELRSSGFKVRGITEFPEMSTPFHIDRMGLLYTRAFQELKSVTAQMEQQIGRVLTEGIGAGDNPTVLARKLVAVIKGGGEELGITDTLGRYIPARRRAEMIARTETIRAHHQATIEEYRSYGADGVRVKAEWVTAGFGVCPECQALEGNVYTLDQIESMIPLHPNCKCVAVPIKI